MSSPAEPLVRMDSVSKNYPGGVRALREVSLSIAHGESVAVVGPSGSGKSTILHLAGALDRPSEGKIFFEGYEMTALSDRELSALRGQRVGFVFQQFHLAAGVSALDNVADGLLYTGVAARERRRRAHEVLVRVGLEDRLSHRPHELSGGEKQRVAIARAVVRRPALLLADEPTGNLDSAAGAEVLRLLQEQHANGATLVVITHDEQIARRMARRVMVRDGVVRP